MSWRDDSAPAARAAFPPIVVECVSPAVDGGRYPAKRLIGDELRVGADIFKDGHDQLAAQVLYCGPGGSSWRHAPMSYVVDDDRWYGTVRLDQIGLWRFTIEAWVDRFGTWRDELVRRVEAGQDVASELLEAAEMVHDATMHARGAEFTALDAAARTLRDARAPIERRIAAALDGQLLALMRAHDPRHGLTTAEQEYPLRVDPPDAGFAAWYELFPRSTAPEPGRHGTFRDAAAALPRITELGFDTVYLPPIHPIGRTYRKGRNNTLDPAPDDVGSPWAIGNEHGGHKAVAPELGTLDDFRAFVTEARRLGLEVALDYALQCSPDHPWVTEHPAWFFIRPDGSIKYAENPPKKYQDIYPINFWCDERTALWEACRDVLLFWIATGVRVFRVDNPHTKPFTFWEWVIGEVHRRHPDVVFLAEAFTRPKRMKNLAKLGFTQSYTYFTWRNTAAELRDYVEELTGPVSEYMRGNFFANTPDILHEYLQQGGRPAFRIRYLLAATLLPVYGIYSGFELYENVPVREGSEEYLDSEKYQIRHRSFGGGGTPDDLMRRVNRIRRENTALQRYANIRFHEAGHESVLWFSKLAWGNDLLIAVTTDYAGPVDVRLPIPRAALGFGVKEPIAVEELLTGRRARWTGAAVKLTLDPADLPGRIFRIIRESTGEGPA